MVNEAKKIYFIGIGGIGISALARILKQSGKDVSGSDLEESPVSSDLKTEQIQVFIGHKGEQVPSDADLVVYSSAVPENNPERQQAKELGITEMSYPETLGDFAKNYEVIAVSGTNGKTTTTAMIATILESAGEDPSAVVGSKVLNWNSNARYGKGKYLVLEADEYRRAFLNYTPQIGVITNIAPDHLDYYKDLADVKSAFREFIDKIKTSGTLVYNVDDPISREVATSSNVKKVSFTIKDVGQVNMNLKVPGEFNRANALAAATACSALGIPEEKIVKGLNEFQGTWRRFQKMGKFEGVQVISDYAHHPDGLEVTFQAIKEVYGPKKVLAVFQPHQHNRTKMLFTEFVRVFCQSELNDFIIAEIFDVAGREETADQNVSSQDLVHEIQKCGKNIEYAKDLAETEQKVREVINSYDAVVFLGAGDIYKIADKLTQKI